MTDMLVFTINACPTNPIPPPDSPPYTFLYVTGSCSPGASLVAIPMVLSPLGTFGVIDPASPIAIIYAKREDFEQLCDNLLSLRASDVDMNIYFVVGDGGQLLVEGISSAPVGEVFERLEAKVDEIGERTVHIEQLLARELPATKEAIAELSEKVEKLVKRLPEHPSSH
ncbi:MAG: hypothetical protein WDO69_27155 [Pseudomonadota bacterium]